MIRLICFINLFYLNVLRYYSLLLHLLCFMCLFFNIILFVSWRVRDRPFAIIGVGDLTCHHIVCHIYTCLNKVQNMRRAPIVVHTDSRSAIQSIVSLTPSNSIVQLIRNRVAALGRSASFSWLPSHTGEPENKRVDVAAKDATSGGRGRKAELP